MRAAVRQLRFPGILIALYGLASIFMLWPLALHIGTALQDLGDPLMQIWAMRWIQHQLLVDPLNLYDGNIFHPFPLPLAYSDAGIPEALIAWPVQLLSGNAILAYNVELFMTYVLAGLGTALLVRHISGNPYAAFLAGLIYAFVPYRYGHLSHLNLLGHGWMPLALLSLIVLWQRPSAKRALVFGLLVVVQGLTALNYLLVIGVGIALYLLCTPWLHRKSLDWKAPLLSLASLALALAILYPIARPYQTVSEGMGFVHTLEEAEELAAKPLSFLSVSHQNSLWKGRLPVAYPSPLFPGAVALAFAVPGVMALRRYPQAGYLLLLALASGILALGPTWTSGQGTAVSLPFRWLHENVPGFESMRDVSRFGPLFLLGVVALAGVGLGRSWQVLTGRLPDRWRLPVGAVSLAALSALAASELRATPVGVVEVDRSPERMAAYHWLAERPDNGPVMVFPADDVMVDPVQGAMQEMYASTLHWHPLVQGYNGFVPLAHLQLIERFRDRDAPLDAYNIGVLQDLGVRYALFHRSRYDNWDEISGQLALLEDQQLIRQHGDIGEARVMELLPVARRKASGEFQAPSFAQTGTPMKVRIAVENGNESLAMVHAGWLPRLQVRWTDAGGRVVLQEEAGQYIPAVVDPGISTVPIEVPVPDRPGDYRLVLSVENAPVTDLGLDVAVRDEPAVNLSGPPIALEAELGAAAYRRGDEIELDLTWTVRSVLEEDYTLFAQLLDAGGQIHGQHDGPPLGGRRPTSDWLAGEVIEERWSLPIPGDAPPGIYRIILGLYSPEDPLRRLPLLGADGSAITELDAGSVEVLPD